MQKFLLTTDTSCDVKRTELNEKGIPWVPLTFIINGETFDDNFSTDEEYKAFYAKISSGAMPTTSQINVFTHEEFFEKAIKNGTKEILHLCLSSGLSSTYNSAKIAAKNLQEKYDGIKIRIVDTLSATQGHCFVLDKAYKLCNDGETVDEAFGKIKDFCSRLHHWVVVNDLHHLKRGGRVSGAAAYVGSVLKIKPILIINHLGKLTVVKKSIGFNKAITEIASLAKEYVSDVKNPVFYIADADCKNGVERLKHALKEAFPNCEIHEGWIGPVIGSHTGIGTLGLVFESKIRLTNE